MQWHAHRSFSPKLELKVRVHTAPLAPCDWYIDPDFPPKGKHSLGGSIVRNLVRFVALASYVVGGDPHIDCIDDAWVEGIFGDGHPREEVSPKGKTDRLGVCGDRGDEITKGKCSDETAVQWEEAHIVVLTRRYIFGFVVEMEWRDVRWNG